MRIVKAHGIYFLVTLLSLITPIHVVATEKAVWNASEVLDLSDQLVYAARRVKVECRRAPVNLSVGGTGGHIEFRYHVNHFESVSRDLSQALEDGKNKKETQPIYTNLVDIMSDLDSYAGREAGGAWPVVSKAVLKANGYLLELGEHYSQP